MWEDLQRQIRSLHLTLRVEGENADQQPSTSGTSSSSNSQSSISSNETQNNESAKNLKKTLIENYKKEYNEGVWPLNAQRPSTSAESTSQKPMPKPTQETPSSSSQSQNSTNISLSNLLPTESELRRMRRNNRLLEILKALRERETWDGSPIDLDVPNPQPSAMSDHTYSSLTSNATVQLPSIASFISNLSASVNIPPSTPLLDSNDPLNDDGPSSSRNIRNSLNLSANPENESTSESSNSALSMDSSPNNLNNRGKQYTYQRVWRYGRRMYIRFDINS